MSVFDAKYNKKLDAWHRRHLVRAKALKWVGIFVRLALFPLSFLKDGPVRRACCALVAPLSDNHIFRFERLLWADWMIRHSGVEEPRASRFRAVLVAFPSADSLTLGRVYHELLREWNLERKAVELGLDPLGDIDPYLFGLVDEGEILGVPWAVLKFLDRNYLMNPSSFREVKSSIISAAPRTRSEFFEFAFVMVARAEQREREALRVSGEKLTPALLELRDEFHSMSDRMFELDHPEFVIRLPGRRVTCERRRYWDETFGKQVRI